MGQMNGQPIGWDAMCTGMLSVMLEEARHSHVWALTWASGYPEDSDSEIAGLYERFEDAFARVARACNGNSRIWPTDDGLEFRTGDQTSEYTGTWWRLRRYEVKR
jgi:hypothetical protein